ncbi:PREDICTED: uncharacterized protein LOC109236562 [Nicotiana attenuata]|uniref:uncharacterized protein LOC109236562 n=1 Tax=Nicotiana attenuata TaxID=49451 RepID=UPI000904F110|nr:PREDICTED: uncharacterized protein LOC109236562 [Nicotiana attenuata]
MGPRRAVDVVTGVPPTNLQEQYEDLAAQQLDLREEMAQKQQELREDMDRQHAELLQMVSSLKSSFDGWQLNQQSKDNASTSTGRDKGLQSGQGILGPNPYCANSSRNHNLLFPRFNGENLKNWLHRIEQYYSVDKTPLNQRVSLVAMNLDDEALVWHQSYMKCRDSLDVPDWDEYLAALIETFSEDFSDPMLELKQLRQTGSVRKFQFAFARLLAQCDLSVNQAISCFLGGLKEELVNPAKVSSTIAVPSPKLALPAPRAPAVPRTRRTISPAEMQARGHKDYEDSGTQKTEDEATTEEWSGNEGDPPRISLCALSGIQGAQTIHVTGYSNKRPLQILLNGGSTHNFIDCESAKRLGYHIVPTKVGYVSLGNNSMEATSGVVRNFQWLLQGTAYTSDLIVFPVGRYDLVLGALWMKTLGPVTMDYTALTMSFTYQGKFHLLKGVSDECKLSSTKAVNKMKGDNVQLFMLQDSQTPAIIRELLFQYHDVFAEPTTLPPSRGAFDHSIPLIPGTKPINIRPYRYSSMKKDIIEQLIKDMLQQGVIQYRNSPFASLVVLVGKKDGSWRLCVDYRELNQCTVKDKFPIPIIDDLLDELAGAVIFSIIDLRSGYHQIRMVIEDIPKTAFKTHLGHYEYLVMPFGLTNAPSTFQCLMNHLFQHFIRKFVLVFFDDILVYSRNLQDHVIHLQQVFEVMVQNSLLAKQSKCVFGVSKVEYLGHFISNEGVATDAKKIAAVQHWKFIKGYGLISRSLTELLKKDNFYSSDSAAQAFSALKLALTTAPFLTLPNYSAPFVVETDVSGTGIGAVLMQHDHPIAFISKGLAPRHLALLVYERELLALVFAVTRWSNYLLGQHFIIKTDQRALKYLLDQKLHTDSQMRWLAKLLPFDFEIQYKKGKENVAADSLSRVDGAELMSLMVSSVQVELWQAITANWASDPELIALIYSLPHSPQKHYAWINNQLRRKGKLVIGHDAKLRNQILTLWHSTPSGGHSRIDATTRRSWPISTGRALDKMSWNSFTNVLHARETKYTKVIGYVEVQQLIFLDPSRRYFLLDGDEGIRKIQALINDGFTNVQLFGVDLLDDTVNVPVFTQFTATIDSVPVAASDCDSSEGDTDIKSVDSDYDSDALGLFERQKKCEVTDQLDRYKTLEKGMTFKDLAEAKEVIGYYAVSNKRGLKVDKSDKRRLRYKCHIGCPFNILFLRMAKIKG